MTKYYPTNEGLKAEEKYEEDNALFLDYKLTFTTEQGARVLKHLKDCFYDRELGPSEDPMYHLGCRHVVLKIQELIKASDE